MLKLFKKFRGDESGAVTVDWVVLTAAVIALAGVAFTQIRNNTNTLATAIGTEVGEVATGTALTTSAATITGATP